MFEEKKYMNKELDRIRELVRILNEASEAYYGENEEIMSNLEYDALEAELEELEEKTGIVLSGSKTHKVGGSLASELAREAHSLPMLSLAKTKESMELASFLGEHVGALSWKLDGLTVVLAYQGGKLAKAVTRGNGQIGELITENARMFRNLPISIPFQGKLVIRGEAIITYSQFEKVNAELSDVATKFKNPRNLCSGSVRQLDSNITKARGVEFYAFSLAEMEGKTFTLHSEQMEYLRSLGFSIVEYRLTNSEKLQDDIDEFSKRIATNDFPSDGLVLKFDNIEYGKRLGSTDKYPRDSMAFKWKDELATTTLKEIIWSASRTGLINPIAVFDPVELEGTTVSRASVHNVSILRELKLGIGDQITVYKANMIIPQIAENLTASDSIYLPHECPSCGSDTVLRTENEISVLMCQNPDCPAKQIKSFTHFVSRNAINIDGISQMSLEKLIDRGFIKEFADLFKLERYKNEIIEMEGFGEKSYEKLHAAIEKARHTNLIRVIFGLGIPNIGHANAKNIAKHFNQDIEKVRNSSTEELQGIDGIGDVLADAIWQYFKDEKKSEALNNLLAVLEIEKPKEQRAQTLSNLTFVITGSLKHFENRDSLKEKIEELGGKVASSVSKNTNYLINNDVTSNSSKNKKAKELDVKIISEENFIKEFL